MIRYEKESCMKAVAAVLALVLVIAAIFLVKSVFAREQEKLLDVSFPYSSEQLK